MGYEDAWKRGLQSASVYIWLQCSKLLGLFGLLLSYWQVEHTVGPEYCHIRKYNVIELEF